MVGDRSAQSLPAPDASWFRALADTTSTAIILYRETFLYANPAAEVLTGYSLEELRHRRFWDIVHPDSRDLVRERGEARLRGETTVSRYEIRILRKDGTSRWVDFTAGSMEVDGELVALGTAFDITELKDAELSLRESRARLELAQQAGRTVVWDWELESDRLTSSAVADELAGFGITDTLGSGTDFMRLVHPDDRQRLEEAIRRTFRGDDSLTVEIRIVLPEGTTRWLAERARAIRDPTGERVVRLIGVAHDITERKLAEEALFREKERAQVTLASIGDGVIRTDARGSIDFLNPVAESLTGWSLADAYGRPLDEVYRVVDEETLQPVGSPVEHCLRERRHLILPGRRFLLHREGSGFPVQDSAAPIRSRMGDVTGAVLVFRDLTELRRMEWEVDQLANRDPLTGLVNRREFEQRVRDAVAEAKEGRRHALAYIDLDDFRLVNDGGGHLAGDELLRQVASLLSTLIGESGTVARLGGDEFGVLLSDCGLERARDLAQEILREVEGLRYSWQGRVFPVGLSLGLVAVAGGREDAESLMSAADAACQVAKDAGRGRIHEYEVGDTALARRHGQMQWISRIHEALDRNRFCLFYQRIAPLDPEDPTRLAEILVRMLDSAGSLIRPSVFIAAAERYRLAPRLDRWVVRSALELLAETEALTRGPTCFAINLSGQSLGDGAFLDYVTTCFERTAVPPDRILFEITETAAIGQLPLATRFMEVLRERGCRFVLDDFGKGLSSFAYLRNLPVDILKIDGEFVRAMLQDPMQSALVRSIHQIGHVLGIRTIAESVESHALLEALRPIGVDFVQGNYVERPRPLSTEGLAAALGAE